MNRLEAVKIVKALQQEVVVLVGSGREVSMVNSLIYKLTHDKMSNPDRVVEEATRIRDSAAVIH